MSKTTSAARWILGASEDEIFEAVQCLIFPAGGPSLMMGIKCLRAVLEERKTSE